MNRQGDFADCLSNLKEVATEYGEEVEGTHPDTVAPTPAPAAVAAPVSTGPQSWEGE